MNDTSVERCLIGTLLHNGFLARTVVTRLEPRAFQDETCEELFRIIRKLFDAGSDIDQNTVTYSSSIPLDEEDMSDILQYNEPDKLPSYTRVIAEQAAKARLGEMFGDIGEDVTPDEFISKKLKLITDIRDSIHQDLSTLHNGSSLSHLFLERLKERAEDNNSSRIMSGIHDLDKMTSGMESSWFVVIGARPSMGKTSLALNIAEYVAIQEKKRVLVFSLEMPAVELSGKLVSSIGRVNYGNIRNGTLSKIEADRIPEVSKIIEGMDIVVDDKAGQTLGDIEFKIRRENSRKKLSLVIIDYLQLIKLDDDRKTETEQIADISKTMKALAKELDLVVIGLAQLNRELEKRADKRPVMSDLRASGQIEQDADLILFPYREFIYTQAAEKENECDLICGKFRHGPSKDIKLKFEGKYSKFSSMQGVCYNNSNSMSGWENYSATSQATLTEATI